MAQGACSRLDPLPKFCPARRTTVPSCSGLLRTKSGSSRQAEKRNCPKPVRSMRLRASLGTIWSVSTSSHPSGNALPSTFFTASTRAPPLARRVRTGTRSFPSPPTHPHRPARPAAPPRRAPAGCGGAGAPARRGRAARHGGAYQVRPAALALAPLEVAVGSRGAALARLQDVGVHPEAHRAPRVAPVEAGLGKDLHEALLLGLLLDAHGSWHDHRPDALFYLLAFEDLRRGPQVLDAGVGA